MLLLLGHNAINGIIHLLASECMEHKVRDSTTLRRKNDVELLWEFWNNCNCFFLVIY